MIYTTLNRILAHNPCGRRQGSSHGWLKLLAYLGKTQADDEPLAYSTIIDSNGEWDALWAMRAEPQHARIWRMYAVRRARSVQHLLTDPRSHAAIDAAERNARGMATNGELNAAARSAAYAVDAARACAYEAASTVYAAARACAYEAASTAHFGARACVYEAYPADLYAMLAAHDAAPGESCELVEWW